MKKTWLILMLCLCLLLSACGQTVVPDVQDGTQSNSADATQNQINDPTQDAQDQTPATDAQGNCIQHVDAQNDGRCDV